MALEEGYSPARFSPRSPLSSKIMKSGSAEPRWEEAFTGIAPLPTSLLTSLVLVVPPNTTVTLKPVTECVSLS